MIQTILAQPIDASARSVRYLTKVIVNTAIASLSLWSISIPAVLAQPTVIPDTPEICEGRSFVIRTTRSELLLSMLQIDFANDETSDGCGPTRFGIAIDDGSR